MSASRIVYPVSVAASLTAKRLTVDVPQYRLGEGFADAENLLLFAHWSSTPEMCEADRYLLKAFRSEGWHVAVASTSGLTVEQLQAGLDGYADSMCSRGNVGYDFGSWSRFVSHVVTRPRPPRRLLLINNSVYGPVTPVSGLMDMMDASEFEVIGFTGSNEWIPHAQSMVMGFTSRPVSHPAFASWWNRVSQWENKWGTILAHELRWFSDIASATHSRAGILFPADSGTRNPYTYGWADLIVRGYPFVKKSLFGANYDGIDMSEWERTLSLVAPDFDPRVISGSLPLESKESE